MSVPELIVLVYSAHALTPSFRSINLFCRALNYPI
jgi:hypothetical protein